MSIFILVVNEEELSVPGDNQRCPNYGYNTRHGTFNTYAKYRCFKLGHAVVVNIWNIDVWPRQKYLTPAVSCYFMSLSDKVSYLLDSIVLLSQILATMISTVKSDRNNLSFTIEDIFKGEFNWNMYEITPPCYVINICILYRLYFNKIIFWRKSLLNTLMQIFIMLRHLAAEISRFKIDDYCVIRTGASDLKLFLGRVHIKYENRIPFMIWKLQTTFSNLSSMKVFEFQLQFHWSLFPRVQLIIIQHWFR